MASFLDSPLALKLLRWLIFAVLATLVPLAAALATQSTRGLDTSIPAIVAHGELLLVAIAICATSAGELFGTRHTAAFLKALVGGFSILTLIFAAIYFADVAAAHLSNTAVDLQKIFSVSQWVFWSSVVEGASCIVLSEL